MAGLIQCPNCLSMVDSEDAFCMLCGHSLAGVARAAVPAEPAAAPAEEPFVYHPVEDLPPIPAEEPAHKVELKKEPVPAYEEPVPETPAPAAEAPALYCPNGHPVTSPDLGFCAVCGALLVSGAPEAPAPAPAEPARPEVRFVSSKCRICGTILYDDSLEYCPNCGNRITRESAVPLPSWICTGCGAENDETNAFCLNCGKPRNAEPAPAEPEKKKHTPPPARPAGMKPPTADDLAVKSRGGNWT